MSDGTFDPLVFDSGVFDAEAGGITFEIPVSAVTSIEIPVSAETSIEIPVSV